MINVTIWNENHHETNPDQKDIMKQIHPCGIHGTLKDIVSELGGEVSVRTVTLDMPENGLTDELLNSTDVLIWWAHCLHNEVSDAVAAKVHARVLMGMGLIVLHSAHLSKPFKLLMGTSGTLRWRDNTYERIFTIEPSHPIAKGLPAVIELGNEECYAERFDIPKPDDIIFEGWFDIGEVFRSGCTWTRGLGRVFYFQPGHETNHSFFNKDIRKIIQNAVLWAAPTANITELSCPHIDKTLEEIRAGK